MQGGMTIRPATDADLAVICALHLANWRSSYAGAMPDAFLGAPVAQEMARRWHSLPAAPDVTLAGEIEGAFAGFALVRMGNPEGPLLESLHVHERMRGSGIGRALIAAVAQAVLDAGHHAMWLEVLAANGAARQFYARLGGQESPEFEDVIAGQRVPAVKVHWRDLRALIDAATARQGAA